MDYRVRSKATGKLYEIVRMECGDQIAVVLDENGEEFGLTRAEVDLVHTK